MFHQLQHCDGIIYFIYIYLKKSYLSFLWVRHSELHVVEGEKKKNWHRCHSSPSEFNLHTANEIPHLLLFLDSACTVFSHFLMQMSQLKQLYAGKIHYAPRYNGRGCTLLLLSFLVACALSRRQSNGAPGRRVSQKVSQSCSLFSNN